MRQVFDEGAAGRPHEIVGNGRRGKAFAGWTATVLNIQREHYQGGGVGGGNGDDILGF